MVKWYLVKNICIIKECNNIHLAKGFCSKHYQRFVKYNDPFFVKRELKQHGMARAPEYKIWAGMKARCFNENNDSYKDYGGRGITVCEEWKNSFMNFHNDMGKRPGYNYQIDRIDNDGNYEPSNCQWITGIENNRKMPSKKLNMEKAIEIRYRYKNNKESSEVISKRHGVSGRTIRDLLANKTWKEA